ncbi:DUF6895 family protein [Saccharothrix obliqua]|uniref:DUF6895 family protein n=1 Tax=Saccharothrix obliqua TaxID=2861747 RepID=UPI001C5F8B08|nr:hypothetical protein [Saccharothrix obliqua]MBW4716427.1 hypothetical protein [Saccharothrix obliqua]
MTAQVVRTAHELSSRALDWLFAHHELGAFPSDPTADLPDADKVYKPLGEVALAASMVLREGVAGRTRLAVARELLEFAWRQMYEGNLLYERQLRHSLITDPLETYAHFSRSGYRHEALDELLTHNAAVNTTTEMVPNRRMAVANARRVVGVGPDADWSALLRATWLGGTPPPWAIDWMTAYHATHTVFHHTDWGARPELLPADVAEYLATWLPVWIEVWAEVRQWDLVGELLIVGLCLPEPHCDPREWERLATEQHADGLVPRDGDPVPEDRARRFDDNQHTAVVAVIAGTLAVSRLLDRA